MIHGHAPRGAWSPTYYSWAAMIQRCTNPARNNYHLYGGKGVKVCARWLSFDSFLADMGERPENTSLDRLDTNGHYEPTNCAWRNDKEQARNRSNSKLTKEDVVIIRRLYPKTSQRALGRRFGVSKTMIQYIVNRSAWA